MQVTKHQSCQKGTAQPPPHCLRHFGSLLEEAFGTSPRGSVWRGRGWTQPGVTTSAPGPRYPLSPPEMSSLAALPYDNDDNQITYSRASACRNKESRFFWSLPTVQLTGSTRRLFICLCLSALSPILKEKKRVARLYALISPQEKIPAPPTRWPDLGAGNGWSRHKGFAFILHQGLWLSHLPSGPILRGPILSPSCMRNRTMT